MSQPEGPTTRARSAGLLLVQAGMSFAAIGWIYVQALGTSACSVSCRSTGYTSLQVQVWVSVIAFIVALILVAILTFIGRTSSWVPLTGTALVLLTAVVTTLVILGASSA